MKKKIIIIIVIVVIILALILLYSFGFKGSLINKECSGDNEKSCDKSCVFNENCARAANCVCYNKNDVEKINYDRDGNLILYELCNPVLSNCACVNKICTNVE